MPSLSTTKAASFRVAFFEWIEFVGQVAESHANNGNDDIGNGRPDVQHLDKQFQAKIIDEDVDDGHEQIPDNLCPTTQSGTRETDVACHPETRQESDGKLEDKGCNVRRESNKSEVEDLGMEDEMIENIVQHPLQSQI